MIRDKFCLLGCALTLCLGAPTILYAQGTAADYERAAELRRRTENTVFRDQIRPHWIADGDQFWYRVDTGRETHEFILVDALQGERRSAFDHRRLAQALKEAGVKDARADRLPIDRLEWEPEQQGLVFRGGDTWWHLDLASYELQEQPARVVPSAARPLREMPRASRGSGVETQITFVNRTSGEVQLLWLDLDGRRQGYGNLAAGQRRAQHTYAGHVWLIVDGDGRPLAWFQGQEDPTTAEIDGKPISDRGDSQANREPSRPRDGTSPDGRWQAFIRDGNVYLRDLQADTEFLLSSDGTAEDAYQGRLRWSPDSAKLVAMRTRQGDQRTVYYVESSPRDQLQPRLHSYEYLKPGDQISLRSPHLFDVATRQEIPISNDLFENPWSINDVRWDRDSSRFTFRYNQRGHQVLRVLAVDAETGEVRALVDEQSETFVDYAGKQFCRILEETREIIWMSERDGWNHLYLIDSATGEVKNQMTRGPWVVRGVERVDEQQRQVWFRAGGVYPEQDPYYVHYGRVNFDGSELTILTEGNGTHTVEVSPDGRFLIDRWSRVDQPPVTELRSARDGKLLCALERADAKALFDTGWQAPERFVAKGRDGSTDIYGVILRPMQLDPNRKYPIIEEIYAGPHGAFTPKNFRSYYKAQALAELGFVVVKLDGMGTSHRSKKFHDVCWKNLGDSGFPDRIPWIRAAAKKYPYMDLERVGIYGGSAGGQSSTRAVLAHGDFYRVAVSDCGCHDNRMDKIWWNELWMGWPVGDHYREQSNVTQAHRLRGKLMLIVGEMDENVDPASTMQVVDALIKADKDFDLLVMPGTGHGAAETPYGTRRRNDYFVRHLLGVEPGSQP
jgi:dipeptidyl aminopeptidase/acylaminoacyl peptidase